ncbi:MAG TPA: iron ABC transporter permease [Chitinivibrionales bacterium]|nr:iron ABC transporter permease [Chitinivibrionales bacterium]
MISKSSLVQLFLLFIATVFVLLTAPFVGMDFIAPGNLFKDDLQTAIFFSLRVPRVLAAFLAGSGLALCGLVFQAMFRNPLADPFTLGIASGSSCGAAAIILAGISGTVFGIPLITFGAFAGAAISMACVYLLSSVRRTSSGVTMLLAGIAISFLFSSILMFMQYISSLRDSFHIVRWLMGGIEITGYNQIYSMLPFLAGGIFILIFKLPELDHLLVGEDLAKSRGVRVSRTKNLLLLAATLIVGSIVSVCGPIGFVGLMTPHICRMIFKTRHTILGPATFLSGGIFLVLCDAAARVVIAPAEMPVGVITALLGGPFFLWLLFIKKAGGTAPE